MHLMFTLSNYISISFGENQVQCEVEASIEEGEDKVLVTSIDVYPSKLIKDGKSERLTDGAMKLPYELKNLIKEWVTEEVNNDKGEAKQYLKDNAA